jgi:hypothetical protein
VNAPARLGIYGACLLAAFGAAFGIAAVVAPPGLAEQQAAAIEDAHGGHGSTSESSEEAVEAALPGLSLSAGGYTLQPIAVSDSVGEHGTLEFSIVDADGEPLTEYETEHEKDLHLIVVRTDGAEFRHVHPELDADGTWSIDWEWDEAGTYRAFADFTPGGSEDGITLGRSIQVGGDFTPAPVTSEERVAEVDGYTASIDGELTIGGESTLTVTIERDGEPVTEIEPYLGAFGHLVALRDGDLAYLHVHPTGAEPEAGDLSGPAVEFATEAPTAGRYLLYFDFQVDGKVHSVPFVLTAGEATTDGDASHDDDSHDDESH